MYILISSLIIAVLIDNSQNHWSTFVGSSNHNQF